MVVSHAQKQMDEQVRWRLKKRISGMVPKATRGRKTAPGGKIPARKANIRDFREMDGRVK
jgi:hypothetical protein